MVTITAATLVSVAITPSSPSFANGTTQQFTIIGTYSDGTTQNLTSQAAFVSSNPAVVSIASTGLATGLSVGSTQISATVGGKTISTTSVSVTSATLVSIAVNPNTPTLANGTTQQFTAIGTYSDGTTQDISSQVVWTSSNPQVLTINAAGLADSDGIGSAQITATLSGVSFTTGNATVTPATLTNLTLSPTTAQIAKGTTQQFTATGTYTDGTTQNLSANVTWSSSNGTVVSINAAGLATGTGIGTSTLTAAYQGSVVSTSSFEVTAATLVSIAFSPANPSVAAGTSTQVTVTGTFSDGTTQDLSSSASYSSSNPGVVTTSSTGLITGVATGISTLTVSVDGITSSFAATVSNATLEAITINPANPTFAKGTSQQFTATGSYSDGSTQSISSVVSWTSSDPTVFTINSNGLATGTGVGSAVLSATYQGQTAMASTVQVGAAAVASIAVTPTNSTIVSNNTQQFTATATNTDSTTQDVSSSTTWTSSNPSVLTIDGNGFATAHTTSVAVATTVTGQFGTATSSVPVSIQPAPVTLASISITPTSAHAAAGTTAQFTATGNYSDGSTANLSSLVVWSSSNPSEAVISNTGLASAVSPGTITVQAVSGTITSQASLVVTAATLTSVAISPSGASFANGTTQQFTLTGSFSDGTTQNLSSAATWTSSAANVATVSPTGLASGVSAGTVQFTATYQGQSATTATVTITPATLLSVAITPSSPSFANGTSQQFTVTGTYSDGTTQNLTSQSTFVSSNTNVVSASTTGLATGISVGSAQVTATVNGLSATTQSVSVTPATLVSIAVTPLSPSFANGTTQQFTAIGTFSDGSTQDLTSQVVWTSSNPEVLTINASGVADSDGTGTAQITATLNGVSFTTGDVTVTPATLTVLTLSPATAQIAKGTTQQFNATGTYSDGTMQNLSSNVTWMSSDGTVASISASGLATGTGVGTAQLTAAYQGQTASTSTLQVTPATLVSIAFTPSTPTVAAGTSAQVIVTGTFSDGTTQDLSSSAAYSSSNPAAVTVSSSGIINGIAAGSSTVTVSVDGLTSGFTATVTNASLVSIAITPSNPAAFANGTTQQFTATGTYSDGTTQTLSPMVLWTSSNTAVVTVDTNGLATGNGVGSASLTATYQGQTATTPNFQVTPATVASIAITPTNPTISNGGNQQFTATATYTDGSTQNLSNSATWSSSNTNVAGISGSGLASALSAGNTTISAQVGSANNSTTLTVTNAPAPTVVALAISPVNASLTAGNTLQYTATATLSDSSTMNVSSSATWSSSTAAVSTISATGLATSVTAGTTTIAAQLGALTSSTTLTVIAAPVTLQSIAITPTSASIAKGSTQQFAATGSYSDGSTQNLTSLVVWASSVSSIATINSSGLAVGSAAGNTQIWADYQGKSAAVTLTVGPAALVSIAVTPQTVTLAAGTTQQYRAVGTMTDGGTQDLTTSVTWSSNNSGIATLNASGLATSHTQGSATITSASGSVTGTAAMTVTSATVTSIQLSPSPVSIPAGDTQQLLATANFTDGSSQNVTTSVAYATSAANVVRVNTAGLLTGVVSGTATITATLGSVATVDNITVNSAVLTSIAITPADPSLPVGLSQQLTATGTFSDGSTQNLSSLATWTSSTPSIATVSATGNVTVAETGNSTITASSGTVTADTTVTGTSAVVTAISVSPASVTLAAGQTQQFAATATLSDGTQQTVTSSAHWSVSNPSRATVSNTSGTNGFLTSTTAGATNVTATLNSISGSGAVTIQAASLTSIVITPNPVSLPAGTNQSLTVTGTYSDGSTANLTASATFGSASSSTAAVNASGLVHGVTAGSTTITATVQGVFSTDSITVTSALLTSIAVTPSSSSVALGLHSQLTATGTYTDGSTANISSSVAWSSSSPAIATVNSAGLVSTLATGSSTLTATLNTISGTANVTVTAAVLQSIAVTAPQNSFSLGLSLQLKAVGTYSDGTTQNLTSTTTWSSQTPTVGVVSSTGLATGHTTGTFNALATTNGVSGSLIVTVTSAVLQSIVVTPANSILVQVGGTVQYTATGQFSDGSTQNLTTSVHWAISNGVTLATINQSGQLSTVGIGVGGTVTATLGAISGSTGFTVVAL